MQNELFETAKWLVAAITKELSVHQDSNVASVLALLAAQELTANTFVAPSVNHKAVSRYYAETIAETMATLPKLAAPLAAIDGHLNWLQSNSYTDDLLGEGFSQNYGSCELIGPNGFFPGNDFMLGLLMLGPHRHYKDHYHPAPELYFPLTGRTQWKQGSGDFAEKFAGEIIFHQPMEHHATKTGSAPLLAVWCWLRDTAVDGQLV